MLWDVNHYILLPPCDPIHRSYRNIPFRHHCTCVRVCRKAWRERVILDGSREEEGGDDDDDDDDEGQKGMEKKESLVHNNCIMSPSMMKGDKWIAVNILQQTLPCNNVHILCSFPSFPFCMNPSPPSPISCHRWNSRPLIFRSASSSKFRNFSTASHKSPLRVDNAPTRISPKTIFTMCIIYLYRSVSYRSDYIFLGEKFLGK